MESLDDSLADFDKEEAALLLLCDANGNIPVETYNSPMYLEYRRQGLIEDDTIEG